MSIWNKILLGLIFVASLGFFHAALRTVKTYQHWANKANDFEKTLKTCNAEILSLRTADHEHPRDDKTIGVQQLRIDLGRVLANRGRIWAKCEKQKAGPDPDLKNPGIIDVTLSTDESTPNTFAKNMLVYAFEEGDDQSPGKFLGEYRVDLVSDKDKKVVLSSTTQMLKSTNPKVKFLADNVMESKGPWVLYETMPTDQDEAFANLPDDQKKLVSEEYLKDGPLVDASGKVSPDPKNNIFKRPPRDYLTIFRDYELYCTLYADRWESALRDLRYLEAADKESTSQRALAEKEKTQVSDELKRALKEKNAVADHLATLQVLLGNNLQAVKAAIAKNIEYAQDIARRQKEAADLIDRRTRSMAQYGPGAN
jgi:hypothetical protein